LGEEMTGVRMVNFRHANATSKHST
jgi:hypothetical protein